MANHLPNSITITWNVEDVTITWNVEDVKSLDPTLRQDECREILQVFERHHEGSMEQMWLDLQYHVDEYKENNV